MLKEKNHFRRIDYPINDNNALAIKDISEITNADQILDFIVSKRKWLYFNCNFKQFLTKIIEINISNLESHLMDKTVIHCWKNIYEEIINNYHLSGNNLYLINTIWYQELRLIYFLYELINFKLLSILGGGGGGEEEKGERENLEVKIDLMQKQLNTYENNSRKLTQDLQNAESKNIQLQSEILARDQLEQNLKDEFNNKISQLVQEKEDLHKNKYQDHLTTMKNDYEFQLMTMKNEYDTQSISMKNQYDIQIDNLKRELSECNARNDRMKNSYEAQITSIKNNHESQITSMENNYKVQIDNSKSQYEQSLKNNHDQCEVNIRENTQTFVAEINQLKQTNKELERENIEMKNAFDNVVKSTSMAQSEVDKYEGIFKKIQNKHEQEIGKLKKQNNTLNLEYNNFIQNSNEKLAKWQEFYQRLANDIGKLIDFQPLDIKKEEEEEEKKEFLARMTIKTKTNDLITLYDFDALLVMERAIDEIISKYNAMQVEISKAIEYINNEMNIFIDDKSISLIDKLVLSVENVYKMYLECSEESIKVTGKKLEMLNMMSDKISDINQNINKYLAVVKKEEEEEKMEEGAVPIIMQLERLNVKIDQTLAQKSNSLKEIEKEVQKIVEMLKGEYDDKLVVKEEEEEEKEKYAIFSHIKQSIITLHQELNRVNNIITKSQDILNKHELKIQIEKEKEAGKDEIMEITQNIDEQLNELFIRLDKEKEIKALSMCKEYFREIFEMLCGIDIVENLVDTKQLWNYIQKMKENIKQSLNNIRQKEISLAYMMNMVEPNVGRVKKEKE